ncbi:hypothetical protein H5410_061435, partial [Solanum commersonii]
MKSTKRLCTLKIQRVSTPRNWTWLARERGRKTKTTKLIAGVIGSTWIQLERVNPSPSLIHSTRESEWAKAEAVLKSATRCLRETESILGKSPSPVGESSISLEITFCSSVLSPKGKDQVGDEMKQSACRRVVPQSSTISPNDSKCKNIERVNPSPSPTHSARESEWAKVEAVLKAATQ